MDCFITHCVAGFIAIDDTNNIISYKLFDEKERTSKLEDISNKKVLKEEIELIEELFDKYDNISIESQSKKSNYNKWENITLEVPNKAGEFLRENLENILDEINFSKETFTKSYRDLAISKVKDELNSEDKYLIQAINSIDDIDESISKLIERIRDWYSLYFPELDIVQNNETYIKLIAENKTKKDIIENYDNKNLNIDDFDDDISKEDLDVLNSFASSIYSLQKSRREVINYINKKMNSLAPNLTDLLGSSLGAKLISHAGGLEKLASYPSGTVQIMGAEKALFRHLKTGENPPKHGLIFQHPSVRTSKWWNRGKIAKKLSLKISLAIRKDVYSGEFDPTISEKFLEEVEKIEKENPFQPRSKNKDKNDSKKRKKRAKR
ncbi:NOP5/NOP56 family protein [Methanobrevibacter sp. DSM 116169]|uniref:NOP5/NOP56 family protein n=1 Tax=Methanobrevibacter sp. DSM 116169 TaxID=3242727 RepID=UPI0038FC7283